MDYRKLWINIISVFSMLVFSCLSAVHAGDSNSLVVGVNAEYKPLVYKENGQLTGIEPATAKALGKLLEKEIVFKEYPWTELIPSLEKGGIDIIMSGMSITDERSQRVDFTQPYLQIGQMAIIRRADIGRLSQPRAMYKAGMRVGVELGTTGEQYVKDYAAEAELKQYQNPREGFSALQQNEIDFFIHDAPTSWKLAQSSNDTDLMALYKPLTNESIAWAVNKNNTQLLNTLNEALETLRAAGTLSKIQYQWIPVKIEVERP